MASLTYQRKWNEDWKKGTIQTSAFLCFFSINNDLDSFLACLDKINDAYNYFEKHQNFKGADKTSQQLSALKTKAVTKLDAEFKNIIQSVGKKEIDPFNLTKPYTEGIGTLFEMHA